jgi:hypothetical protein
MMAAALEEAEQHAHVVGRYPVQPLALEPRGAIALDRERRKRAGVVAEDQAALPAGTPAAVSLRRRLGNIHPDSARREPNPTVPPRFLQRAC